MTDCGSTQRTFTRLEQAQAALGGCTALDAKLKREMTLAHEAQMDILFEVLNSQLAYVQEDPRFDVSSDVYFLGHALAAEQDVEFSNEAHSKMLQALIKELSNLDIIPAPRLLQLGDLFMASWKRIKLQVDAATTTQANTSSARARALTN